jgi:hypothetical protein
MTTIEAVWLLFPGKFFNNFLARAFLVPDSLVFRDKDFAMPVHNIRGAPLAPLFTGS